MSHRSRRSHRHKIQPSYLIKLQNQLESRFPLLGGLFRFKAAQTISEAALSGDVAATRLIANACSNLDPQVADIAVDTLKRLTGQICINAVWEEWIENRSNYLGSVLKAIHKPATLPLRNWCLSQLFLGNSEGVSNSAPDVLPFLLEASNDKNVEIRAGALYAASSLQKGETRQAFCQFVIDHCNPQVIKIAIDSGYLPDSIEKQVLYFFLTDQWERYEKLDFDLRIMRTIYNTATPELRQRIATQLQQSGRTDFIEIMTGLDSQTPSPSITPTEAKSLIVLLTDNQEWEKLWNLAFELAVFQSIEIIQILSEQAWKPISEIDQITFQALVQLSNLPITLKPKELEKSIPLAIPVSKLNVHGRMNDLAFATQNSWLLIGSGQRKLILWDYQKGEILHVYRGFNHSIGKVAFLEDDTFLCGERSNQIEPCGIYFGSDSNYIKIGDHLGTVGDIIPIGNSKAISIGRDSQVMIWDMLSNRLVNQQANPFWARSCCVDLITNQLGLFHNHLSLFSFPDLKFIKDIILQSTPDAHFSIPRCSAFIPGGNEMITGQFNGQVIYYSEIKTSKVIRKIPLAKHISQVVSCNYLQKHNLLLTGGAEGTIQFHFWPDKTWKGSIQVPGERLTSLVISEDCSFMASGDDTSLLNLWDLRVLDIPGFFETSIKNATTNHLSIISYLMKEENIPQPVKNALNCLFLLLKHRFQFDVQVSEIPNIQLGEFDIMVE